LHVLWGRLTHIDALWMVLLFFCLNILHVFILKNLWFLLLDHFIDFDLLVLDLCPFIFVKLFPLCPVSGNVKFRSCPLLIEFFTILILYKRKILVVWFFGPDLVVLELVHFCDQMISTIGIADSLVGSLLFLSQFHDSSFHESFMVLGCFVLYDGFHHVIICRSTNSCTKISPIGLAFSEIGLRPCCFIHDGACLVLLATHEFVIIIGILWLLHNYIIFLFYFKI